MLASLCRLLWSSRLRRFGAAEAGSGVRSRPALRSDFHLMELNVLTSNIHQLTLSGCKRAELVTQKTLELSGSSVNESFPFCSRRKSALFFYRCGQRNSQTSGQAPSLSAAAGQVALSRNPGPLVNLNLRPDLNKVLGLNLLPHGRFSTGAMRWVLLLTLHENIHAPLKVHFIPPQRTQARP